MEEKVTNRQLIGKFFQAARKQEQLEIKYIQGCPSVRKAIVFYRDRTWEHQDMQGETRRPTYYPERKRQACGYKRFVAKKWIAHSRTERKQLEKLMSSDYGFAKVVINGTFPPHARATALEVVRCESRYKPWAHNTITDVRGYWQIQNEWIGETLYHNGRSLTVKDNLYDPWYNTRVAYFLSKGGTDFSWHWAASAYCWG